ncbi:hypothetical protein V6N11_025720 [Hibiscus sabdariffa]|uniref:Uncharacterized protein n=1 Tax=Hibiscus sabdariffa TaxID=183260 RepID=A0ABR2SUC4_9ROSI
MEKVARVRMTMCKRRDVVGREKGYTDTCLTECHKHGIIMAAEGTFYVPDDWDKYYGLVLLFQVIGPKDIGRVLGLSIRDNSLNALRKQIETVGPRVFTSSCQM